MTGAEPNSRGIEIIVLIPEGVARKAISTYPNEHQAEIAATYTKWDTGRSNTALGF